MSHNRPQHPFLLQSATQLAALIRTRQATSREVVQVHVDHARRVNQALNAIVVDRYDAALDDADAADAHIASHGTADLPPFFGVPCTIKECFAVEGFPQTSGLISRKHKIATRDAPTVARIRQSGAILLGVTNVSELCMWMESDNCLYGITGNAYDPTRTAGGSSGGEGSIVGSGASPFGLGADVGGSIRMPAFFNGVFGHKASAGIVPNSGQHPVADPGARRLLSTGPLCRRAEDLWPLLQLLAGPDGEDQCCTETLTGNPADVRIADLTVWNIADNGFIDVDPELRGAQDRVVEVLRSLGATVKPLQLDVLRDSFEIWSASMAAGAETHFVQLMGDDAGPVNAWAELVRRILGKSEHTAPAILLGIGESLQSLLPGGVESQLAVAQKLREDLTALLGPNGVFLFPSYARPAPKHHHAKLRPLDWVYTGIGNVLHMPITQVPLGLGEQGVPLGVQVGARHGNDAVTIAVACALERELGGWVLPNR